MGKFGKELLESLSQAAAHAEGRRVTGVRVTKVEIPDMRAMRRSPRMRDAPDKPQRISATGTPRRSA
jgi:hypothetical protein